MNYVTFPDWGDFQLKGKYPPSEWVYDVLEIVGTVGCASIAEAIAVWDDENPKAFRSPADEYHLYVLSKAAIEYAMEDEGKQDDELDYGGRFLATEEEYKTYNKLKNKFEENK